MFMPEMKIVDSYIHLPEHELFDFCPKKRKYLICIPVINEGNRFLAQLDAMKRANVFSVADLIICDGGSTDGSVTPDRLREYGASALVVCKSPGQSNQLMLGYYYALINGYEGTITVDGNGKDGVEGIFGMAQALDDGLDMVQGSRYLRERYAINTPMVRELAIKYIHVPIINALSGFHYTDTTNGFRAHSIRVMQDMRIQPFRYGDFPTYDLVQYLTVRVPRLGYRIKEIPVVRKYPAKGKTVTKISPFKGNLDLLRILWNIAVKKYDP